MNRRTFLSVCPLGIAFAARLCSELSPESRLKRKVLQLLGNQPGFSGVKCMMTRDRQFVLATVTLNERVNTIAVRPRDLESPELKPLIILGTK